MKAEYHFPKSSVPEKSDLKKQGFYHSPEWRKLRVVALQRDHYLCQNCLRNHRIKKATEVHHIKPVMDFPELALDLGNLESLCWRCHEETKRHGRCGASPGVRVIKVSGSGDKE